MDTKFEVGKWGKRKRKGKERRYQMGETL